MPTIMKRKLAIILLKEGIRHAVVLFDGVSDTVSAIGKIMKIAEITEGCDVLESDQIITFAGGRIAANARPWDSRNRDARFRLIKILEEDGGGIEEYDIPAAEKMWPGIEFSDEADAENGLVAIASDSMDRLENHADIIGTLDVVNHEFTIGCLEACEESEEELENFQCIVPCPYDLTEEIDVAKGGEVMRWVNENKDKAVKIKNEYYWII